MKRSEFRRLARSFGFDPNDPTYGGMLPADCRFEPSGADVYENRIELRPGDVVAFNRGRGDDGMVSVSLSHPPTGVMAIGTAADEEQAGVIAVKLLRGRVVLARIERERKLRRDSGGGRGLVKVAS